MKKPIVKVIKPIVESEVTITVSGRTAKLINTLLWSVAGTSDDANLLIDLSDELDKKGVGHFKESPDTIDLPNYTEED